MSKLSFLSRGTHMVFDFEAQDAGVLRFVGRKHDRNVGHEGVDENGVKYRSGGFPSTGEPQEVPMRPEYAKACRDGSLWPANEETAAYCGVPFDPTFGGEHDKA